MPQLDRDKMDPDRRRKQDALAGIEGLEIGDVLNFFYHRATPRDKKIADMVDTSDELEVDGAITSEGADNGAWVLAWTWVEFDESELDANKEKEIAK